jgi:hypothetical protein
MACVSSNNNSVNYWDDDERNVRTIHNPWRRDATATNAKEDLEPLEPLLLVCRAILEDVMNPRKMIFDEVDVDENDYSDDSSSSSSSSSPSAFLDGNYCAKSSSLSSPSYEGTSDDFDMPGQGNNDICEADKDDNNQAVDCAVHVTPFFYT